MLSNFLRRPNRLRRPLNARVETLERRQLLSISPTDDEALRDAAALAELYAAPDIAALGMEDLGSGGSAALESAAVETPSLYPITQTVARSSTEHKPQSKVWRHDGKWFAAFPDDAGTKIWRLDGALGSQAWTEVVLVSNGKYHADVLPVPGSDVVHMLLYDGTASSFASVQYSSSGGGTYSPWSVRPANVSISLSSGVESGSIALDSTGRMWLASDANTTMEVRYADSPYSAWSAPITLGTGATSDDIADIATLPNGTVGVLWSDQNAERFKFRYHLDTDPPATWSAEEIPADAAALNSGLGMADDHMSMVVASDGTVYAAVKTGYAGTTNTLVGLLVRRPNGLWDPSLYHVDTDGTRPQVALNEALGAVLVMYTNTGSDGPIVFKQASTGDLVFGDRITLIDSVDQGIYQNDASTVRDPFTDQLVVISTTDNSGAPQTYLNSTTIAYPSGGNLPPVVDAGLNQSVVFPTAAVLDGTVTDDGLPAPPALTTQWSLLSGPLGATVTFGDAALVDTTATFSAFGTYVLRLTADDGGGIISGDNVTITVLDPNNPPVVSAGPDRTVGLSGTLFLDGDVTDDGLPGFPTPVTQLWSMVSGPGTVTFGDAALMDTSATFSAAGTYVLRLTGNDGVYSASDDMTVTVLGGTTVQAFQDGVSPTAAYAGTRDTYITSGSSTTQGTSTSVLIDGNPDQAALLSFDITSLTPGTTISAASLTFYVNDASSDVFQIYELKRAWEETQATFVNAATGTPWQTAGAQGALDRGTTSLGTVTSSSTGSRTFNLNAAGLAVIQSWINNPTTNFGFFIGDYATAGNSLGWRSSELSTLNRRPMLSLTYSSDTLAPTVDIVDVGIDPRNTPVSEVLITFSEPVVGFDLADLTLTQAGGPNLLTPAQTLSTSDNITFTLGNLSGITGTAGLFNLTLNHLGSQITDNLGNLLTAGASDTWTVDLTAPTADIADVTPDPRGTSVSSVVITFSEPVTGVSVSDFQLTRNGGANLLTGGESLTTSDNTTFTLGGLSGLTSVNGNYSLTLVAAGSGIVDSAMNALAGDAGDAFLVDLVAPTADVVDVTPDPRTTPVSSILITFSEAVSGVDLADLSLARNGGANLITGAQTLTTSDNVTYTLGNLAGITAAGGNYAMTVNAAGAGIVDVAGNSLAASASDDFFINPPPTAAITQVAPSPRNSAVSQIEFVFSEEVLGFDAADLQLTRNGGGNLLGGSQVVITSDNVVWTLVNLAGITGTTGNYLLSLNAAGSGIVDSSSQLLANSPTMSFAVDTTAPTADIVDVSPDPRATPVSEILITFSEAVSGLDIDDFSFTRDGGPLLLTGSTLTTSDNVTYTLGGLGALTAPAGSYALTLNAAGSGIVDQVGNALAAGASDSFVVDLPPTATINPVSPNPRNTGVAEIEIVFSEEVLGFDLTDLRLTRDGGANLLTGSETLASGDSTHWTLGGISGLTSAPGSYQLTLVAAGSGISDGGQTLAGDASTSFAVETTPPTADIIDVTPDPRNTPVGSILILFSEQVAGFDLGDLTLTLGGGPNLLPGGATLTTSSNVVFTLGNLSGVISGTGTYVLSLNESGSGIADLAGNALAAGASDTFVVDIVPPTADVVDISPDPRNTAVDVATIVFSEPVSGVNLADLSLTRDGGANLLTGGESLTTSDNVTFTLSGLAGLTGAAGSYAFTVAAAGSGITDALGNAMVADASDTWQMDLAAPTADVTDVTPDPRNTPVSQMTIIFSEAVTGLDLADLAFTKDGGPNLLTGSQTLSTSDNVTWTLSNLGGLTALNGTYVLSVNAAGSGIADLAGNALAAGASDSFLVDLPPSAAITPVAPNPRNTAVSQITIVFSEAVLGFNLADMTLTLNGGANLLNGGQTLTTSNNITYTLGNLSGITGAAGNYLLTLTAAGSGIRDASGNFMTLDAATSFTVDTTAPTVNIVDVTPDPRNSAVGSVSIVFSEAVSGFDLADLSLTLDGGSNLLTGSQTLTTSDNITFTLGNLAGVTAAEGTYTLTLTAAGSGITDPAANALALGDVDSWLVDATAPAADVVDVTPDPRNAPLDEALVVFSEPVSGLDLTDLSLTRNGGANLLTGSESLTTSDNVTFTLGNLTALTNFAGIYEIRLNAAGSGIADGTGNALAGDASDTFAVDVTPPTADVVDVTPDPRMTAVSELLIVFSELVSGVDLADLSLTLDGGPNLLTGGESLTTSDSVSYTLSGLSSLTAGVGNYLLTVHAAGSGIQDTFNNLMAVDASDAWVVDLTAPTVDILDVTPDPRNASVGAVLVQFNEPVVGLDISDFTLSLGGGPNLLTGAQTVTTSDNVLWTIGNLSGVTSAAGSYTLTLNAAGSNITDLAGNALAAGASDSFLIDLTAPTADLVDVTPDPRNTAVAQVTIVFSEPVSGFDLADLSLSRDGGANLLSGSQSLSTSDSVTFTLSGLTAVTSVDGHYVLTLAAAGSGIVDTSGNALAGDAGDDFTSDVTAPTADIVDIAPDPRNSAVGQAILVLSEAVTGLDLADLSLTRDGGANLLTGSQTLSTSDNVSFTLGNLAGITAAAGSYSLSLTAAGSGIADLAGNALAADAGDAWNVDLTAPTVDIADVTPDPRNAPVDQVLISFSEPISGLDLADLSLTRNGGANLLGGSQSLSSSDNVTFTLSGLSAVTAPAGAYLLTLTAGGSGIQDAAGNALAVGANDAFLMDLTAPTADIVDVSPDPRNTPVAQIVITFSEAIGGLDLADLTLTRNGGANLLNGAQTLSTSDNVTWTLGNVAPVTAGDGAYLIMLHAAGSGIVDTAGNALAADVSDTFSLDGNLPTLDILDITPDPRNAAVNQIYLAFSEIVLGLDVSDIRLTRNGGSNLLTGAESLSTSDNITFALGGVAGLTALDGSYTVSLAAAGSGIVDTASNPLSNSASDTWTADFTAPTADIVDVTPDPRNAAVSQVLITFSEAVIGLDLADLTLARNGGPSLLGGSQTITTSDNVTFTLGNLAGLTGVAGSYTLTLHAAGSGVSDPATNALAGDVSDTFSVDVTAPTADVVDVTPDPRNSAISQIVILLSEAVGGLDLADLSLTRDGGANLLTGAQTLSTSDNVAFTLGNLAGITGTQGSYVVTLHAAGSGIQDPAANALAGDASDAWVLDTTLPTADVVDVAPDPRNGDVASIVINFSEPVSGLDLADLSLTRDGGANLLSGSQSLATADNTSYTLSGLSGITAPAGSYLLTLTAAGSGIVDGAGNALAADASDAFAVDLTAPTADVVDVTPDPRNVPVAQIVIAFSEAVSGLDLADLTLTRNGGSNLLTGAQTLGTADNVTWTLGNVGVLTAGDGVYQLTLHAAGSGVVDTAGNALVGDATDLFTLDGNVPTADVVDVVPDPRNVGVAQVLVTFSEIVVGVDVTDFRLTRNGGANLLTGTESVSTSDNVTYTLSGLTGLTTPDGNYLVSLVASGSGIVDTASNGLANSPTDSFLVETVLPTADIIDVVPDPRNSAVSQLLIVFSEPVSGFDLADLSITRNGGANLLNGGQTLTTSDSVSYTLGGLGGLTGPAGDYLVTLTALGSGILDTASNAMTAGATEFFRTDLTAPVADIVDVVPDPRNLTVSQLVISLSEVVAGLDLSDLSLTRNGGANLLNGGQTLTTVDNMNFTLGNLSGLTGVNGVYTLTLTAAGSGISDLAGNALAAGAGETWTADFTAPTADITDVTPDPRNAGVSQVTIVFSEVVTGLDAADFTLTRDGGANLIGGSQTLSTSDNVTFTLGNLGGITAPEGVYLLSLNAASAGVQDLAANSLAGSVSDSFLVDLTAPTASIVDVTPDPHPVAVTSLSIVMSELVTGLDLADLTLTRNGGANLLTGGETLTTSDNVSYTLGNLGGLIGTNGNYVLTLVAAGSGVLDTAGNALAADASESFDVDVTPRIVVGTHTLLANTPGQAVPIYVIGGQPVQGLDFFAQVGDGGPELTLLGLPAGSDAPEITGVDLLAGTIFSSMSAVQTNHPLLPQVANSSAVLDSGSVIANGLLVTLTVDTTGFFGGSWDLLLGGVLPFVEAGGPYDTNFAGIEGIITNGTIAIAPSQVVGRQVFYNNSAWDGSDPAANAADDAAVATDKTALLPGGTASFANYTSYSRGINGVMVDVDHVLGTPTVADFDFQVGNNNTPGAWAAAPAPASITVRSGAGVAGSDRITITWADGAISKQWLRVSVNSGGNVGLDADDVFYFGNAVGEVGNSTANALVNATDEIAVRTHPVGPFPNAAVTNLYDLNRDRLVNSTDQIIARTNSTSPLNMLKLIAVPAESGGGSAALADAYAVELDAELVEAVARRRTRRG